MTDCSLFGFIVWGIGGVVLFCFGYTGNLLSLIALQRDTRTPATTLLQALSVSDLVLLTCVCVTDFVPKICEYTGACQNIWHVWPQVRFLWFLIPMAHMCSIWLAVLIAGNRYWAVCRIHDMGQVWTNRRTWIYIACVVFGVVIFNVPRMFEYQIVATSINRTRSSPWGSGSTPNAYTYLENGNEMTEYDLRNLETTMSPISSRSHDAKAVDNAYDYSLESARGTRMEKDGVRYNESKTAFGESLGYRIVYKVILVNCLLILLPLWVLLVTSVWVIRSLRLTNATSMVKKSKKPGSPRGDDRQRSSPSREVTFLLVTVVLVAVACQTPLAVFHFVRYLFKHTCGDTIFYLENISKFLVNLNSCANFVVYCILGPRFRRLLVLALTCSPRGQTSRDHRLMASCKDGGAGELEMLKEGNNIGK